MKPRTKNILVVIAILAVTFITNRCHAQTSDNLIVLGGYKSIEVGYSYNNEDFLNFGYSFAIQDSKIAEHRANNNDIYNRVHEFNNKVVPAGFALIGASFRPITITGKIGASYLNQKIDGIQDKQKIWFAIGIMLSHDLNERFSIVGSYDNVSSVQAGLIYKF